MNRLEIVLVILGSLSGLAWVIYALVMPDLEPNFATRVALQMFYYASIAACFRDIYLRSAVGRHTKLVWGAVIVLLGSIGLVVYTYKFGVKDRTVDLVT